MIKGGDVFNYSKIILLLKILNISDCINFKLKTSDKLCSPSINPRQDDKRNFLSKNLDLDLENVAKKPALSYGNQKL